METICLVTLGLVNSANMGDILGGEDGVRMRKGPGDSIVPFLIG